LSLPLVTRFGADPLQDLEVANKRYVDTSGGSRPVWYFSMNQSNLSGTSLDFFAAMYGGADDLRQVLAEVQIEVTRAFTLLRQTIVVSDNSKTGTIDLSFVDDGALLSTTTILAGTTGNFDSGVLSLSIAADSLCACDEDFTSGGTGSFACPLSLYECEGV